MSKSHIATSTKECAIDMPLVLLLQWVERELGVQRALGGASSDFTSVIQPSWDGMTVQKNQQHMQLEVCNLPGLLTACAPPQLGSGTVGLCALALEVQWSLMSKQNSGVVSPCQFVDAVLETDILSDM